MEFSLWFRLCAIFNVMGETFFTYNFRDCHTNVQSQTVQTISFLCVIDHSLHQWWGFSITRPSNNVSWQLSSCLLLCCVTFAGGRAAWWVWKNNASGARVMGRVFATHRCSPTSWSSCGRLDNQPKPWTLNIWFILGSSLVGFELLLSLCRDG